MKITISYIPAEAKLAEAALKLLRPLFPDATLRSSITHPPRKTVYLTVHHGEKH